MHDFIAKLEQHGFAVAPQLLTDAEIADLQRVFDHAPMARAQRGGQTFGARNLLELSEVQNAATSPKLAHYLAAILSERFKAVRAIFFDKTENANWPVLWHQDLSLAVKERRELAGWKNWSVKQGVEHVQAPQAILERMITVRLHLDPCPVENGALCVIAGSHAWGPLSREAIRQTVADQKPQPVPADAGDGLFMRPLILHASSPAQAPRHRRVLHLEFAPDGLLPDKLERAH